jgi:Carboxypeptidase regulatory-like domain
MTRREHTTPVHKVIPRAITLIVLLALLFAGARGALTTGVARANYTITICQNGNDGPPFVNLGYSTINYDCTGTGSGVLLDGEPWENSAHEAEAKLGVGVHRAVLEAPTGITIDNFTVNLVSETEKSGSSVLMEAGDGDDSFYSQTISRQSATTANISRTLPAGDNTLWFSDVCTTNENTSCFFASPTGILTIEDFSLTLDDDEAPALSLTGGRLLIPGSQAGTENLAFSASAQDSGIAEVNAYLGSTLVGSNDYRSTQCSYTTFDPCPKTISDDIQIDTSKVPDGTYPLVLEASDASGTTSSVSFSNEITVANNASPASAPQSAGARSSSSDPGAPNGRGATTKAQISYLGGQRGKITVRDGQAASIDGRLTNQTGNPIPGATVDLLYQTVGSSEPFVVGGHATTNANGAYTFTVPPGPSRVIRTGYRAFVNDNGYDATADLTEDVTAATSLTVTPNHLRGRTFIFSGQVHASDFPAKQLVEIQALVGHTWTHVTFATVTPSGHFKMRYRLKHHYNNVTFIFRATPVANPLWPYEPTQSNLTRLHML